MLETSKGSHYENSSYVRIEWICIQDFHLDEAKNQLETYHAHPPPPSDKLQKKGIFKHKNSE